MIIFRTKLHKLIPNSKQRKLNDYLVRAFLRLTYRVNAEGREFNTTTAA